VHGGGLEVDGAAADDDVVARVVAAVTTETTPVRDPEPAARGDRGTIEIDHHPLELLGPDGPRRARRRYAHRVAPDVIAAFRLTARRAPRSRHHPDRAIPRHRIALTERGATARSRTPTRGHYWLAEALRAVRVDRFGGPGAGATPRRTIVRVLRARADHGRDARDPHARARRRQPRRHLRRDDRSRPRRAPTRPLRCARKTAPP